MASRPVAQRAGGRRLARGGRRTNDAFLRRLAIEPLEDRRLLSVAGQLSDFDPCTPASVITDTATAPPPAEFSTDQAVEDAGNRWVIRFSPELDTQQRMALVAAQGAAIVADLPLIDGAVIETPKSAAGRCATADAWSAVSGVVYAAPDDVIQVAATTPNDPLYSSLWGMNNTGQDGGTAGMDIDAPEAWDLSTGSSTVVVADIDTGVDYTHPDLAANMWTNPGEVAGDSVDNDGNGYVDDVYGIDACNNDSDPMDDNGHGTHTAGTIGAVGNNGIGVAGVNWNVKIMALKFLSGSGSGSLSSAVICLQYVTRMKTEYGVNVVASSNSWAGASYHQALYDAIAASNAAGVMFVAAAGNMGNNSDLVPQYPAAYDLPGIISVAAINSSNRRASFSNYGSTSVDLGAPGVNVLSTTPDGNYGAKSGTSMATPHVAGAVALAAAYAGNLSLPQVKAAILDSVDPVPDLAGRSVSGGRLNVNDMLQKLGLTVTECAPASGGVVTSRPVDFTLCCSDSLDPATIQPADLTVNGDAATSVTQVDATTLRFHYATSPVVAQGPQTMAVAAGSLERLSDHDSIGRFSATFYYDTLPLQIAATSPAQGTVVTLPLSTLRIDFNEPIWASSVDVGDLLLSQGRVASATVVDADSVVYTLSGVVEDSQFTVRIPAAALYDQYGTPIQPYEGVWYLDGSADSLSVAFAAMAPAGSLIYQARADRDISFAGDNDSFEFTAASGQTVTVVVEAGSGLRPVLQLCGPGGAVLSTAQGTGPGRDAVLQTFSISAGGTYSVTVGGLDGGTGAFGLEVILNAAAEAEEHGGLANDDLAGAQDLSGSLLAIDGTGAMRGAVVGSLALPCTPVVTVVRGEVNAGDCGLAALIDGVGVRRGRPEEFGTLRWTDPETVLEIDLGATLAIRGLSVQGDCNDVYRLEYWDVAGATWNVLWDVPDYSSRITGFVYRPDFGYTDAERFHRLDSIVATDRLRVSAVSGMGLYALADIELELAPDLYCLPLAAGQSLSLAAETSLWTYNTLELLDAAGNVVAIGSGVINGRQTIDNFVASTAGTYYARVSGLGDYALVATRGAGFEAEPNGTAAPSPQTLLGSQSLLGEIGIQAGERSVRPPTLGAETYRLDGNWLGLSEGLLYGGDILWMNQFSALPGADCIDSIAVAFGDCTPIGSKAQVLLYDDPNEDGDPHDAVLLTVADTMVAGSGTGNFVTVPIAPTRVSGSFFVAALVRNSAPGEFPLMGDLDSTRLGRSWVVLARANELDEYDLDNNLAGPANPIRGWMIANYGIRANAAAPVDDDRFRMEVAAGAALVISTRTPGDTQFNTLDPRLELYDPQRQLVASDDNSSADGKNAVLHYTALAGGSYTVRVAGVGNTHGEYRLEVSGAGATNPGPRMADATPPLDGTVATFPTTYTLHFSEGLRGMTFRAADLRVAGYAALAVTQVDGNTLRYTLDSAANVGHGTYAVRLAAGAVYDLQGMANAELNTTFQVDQIGPRVAAVAWNGNSLGADRVLPAGSLTFEAVFDTPLLAAYLDTSDVKLVETLSGQAYQALAVVYDPARFAITATYVGLPEGIYRLALVSGTGAFEDPVGNDLDGEPTVSTLDGTPSGNGTVGGDFTVSFLLDGQTRAIPAPLLAVEPAGARIFEGLTTSAISSGSDEDRFTLTLDDRLQFTVLVDPCGGLRPQISVLSPAGVSLGTAIAGSSGADALLQSIVTVGAGTYTFVVRPADNAVGHYTLRIELGAALESECHGGAANNSQATAQDLTVGLATVGGMQLGAVLGQTEMPGVLPAELEPNDTLATANSAAANYTALSTGLYHMALTGTLTSTDRYDYFNIGHLDVGDVLTVSQSGVASARGTLAASQILLYRDNNGSPELIASSLRDGPGEDTVISEVSIKHADMYYVYAGKNDPTGGTYALSFWLTNTANGPDTGGGPIVETEPNDSIAAATDASAGWHAVTAVSATTGNLIPDDLDTLRFDFVAGEVVSVYVDSTSSTLDARVSIFGPDGTLLALEDGTSLGSYYHDSLIYGFAVPQTGSYYVHVAAASGTGDYVTRVYRQCDPSPPVGQDFYGLDLVAGQRATFALKATDVTAFMLTLTDGTNDLAAAAGGATNVDRAIVDFTVSATGRYYLRIDSTAVCDYTLVVGVQGVFDLEPNDRLADAQPLVGAGTAAGAIQAAGDLDCYQFLASGGELVTLWTTTSSEDASLLDPVLSLYNSSGQLLVSSDNDAGDGRNALLQFRPAQSGTYIVCVSGARSSSGQYLLQTQGAGGGTITGAVFQDLDSDGTFDQGEPPLAGWTVRLDLNNDGTVDRTATTDAAGGYRFSDVPAGTHRWWQVVPEGWIQDWPPDAGAYTAQLAAGQSLTGENFGNRAASRSLDVDGNGTADALTDGILILRYLFAPTGDWTYADAVGPGATRTTRSELRSHLDPGRSTMLDVDGNGTADALTDGILILRYLFAPNGTWAYGDAIGTGATRTTRDAIRAFLDSPVSAASAGNLAADAQACDAVFRAWGLSV
jgi:subtilisin family serine protease